jgi:anti-sigma factor RsiW
MNQQTENEIRDYLLGRISGEEQSRVEERLITDSAYFERVELAEDDLIEEYVRGELSASEREGFENHFLCTPERQQRVGMARTLRGVLSEEPEPLALPQPVRWPKTAWLALAATLLVSIGTIAYLLLHVANVRETAANREREWQQRLSEPAPVSFLLLPDVVMRGTESKESSLLLPAMHQPVQLDLALDPDTEVPAGSRILLRTVDGVQVWHETNVSVTGAPPRRTIQLTLPAGVLVPGRYRLTLLGTLANGQLEELENYSFRVIQR